MILAEIAEKMLPASFYIGAAFLFGMGTAAAFTFLKGVSRFVGIGIVALVAAFLAWGLQIDADLIEAARNELGQDYLIISRYWIVGSVAIAITLSLMFRSASSRRDSARKQEAEQVAAPNRPTRSESEFSP